jgi:hypothetical protein
MPSGSNGRPATVAPVRPVRTAVRALLERSKAYQALPLEEQQALANHMVKVGSYLAEPGWLDAPAPPAAARALGEDEANPVDDLKKRLASKPGQVGAEFQAGAVREGVQQFGQLVQKVDFPAFVSGLVNGVFKAVVDASIEQMKAYGELLAATAKTVDQFASDHITEGQARDYIANRYPSAVQVDTSGEGGAKLKPVEGEAAGAVDLGKAFNVGKDVDLSDEASELALVNAAKLEMARSRQQLMATMVLLGINRIVVTNGQINAKVIFDMRADDSAKRKAKAEMYDEQKSHAEAGAVAFGWGGAAYANAGTSHVATVGSAVDDTSESKAEVKANLSGEVKLNFKSETFPLERMVDTGGMQLLNQRAQPGQAAPAPPTTGATR